MDPFIACLMLFLGLLGIVFGVNAFLMAYHLKDAPRFNFFTGESRLERALDMIWCSLVAAACFYFACNL